MSRELISIGHRDFFLSCVPLDDPPTLAVHHPMVEMARFGQVSLLLFESGDEETLKGQKVEKLTMQVWQCKAEPLNLNKAS